MCVIVSVGLESAETVYEIMRLFFVYLKNEDSE